MLTLSDNTWTQDYEHNFTLRDIHEAFGLNIGLRDYPIFDEEYREVLNQRIYDHFAYREIAADTPQMFVYYLNRRMRENMPTFNAIYKEMLKEAFDPFASYVTDGYGNSRDASASTTTGKAHEDNTTTSNTSSIGTATVSETPATFMNDPTEPRYMSNLTQNKGTSDTTGNSQSDGTTSSDVKGNTASDYINHVTARSGYLGDSILNALTAGFLNTDLMVCEMLEPCFMQVWNDQPV